jgi:beta-glucanase (GH16 family)
MNLMFSLVAFALFHTLPGVLTGDIDPKIGKNIVWQDEFQKDGLPDTTKWSYEKGLIRNHEAQFYTEGRLANARISNGELTIEARQEEYQGAKVTSAALESVKSWTHGYFEFKAKIPTGVGTWPAIWFLGDGIRKSGPEFIGWPKCGEIDLMENVGFDPEKMHFNIHVEKTGDAPGSTSSHHIEVPKVWEGYHIYGLDYQAHQIDFYFDGAKVMSYLDDGKGEASWPFDKPQFIILNLAIGGDWGGQHGVEPSIYPSKFQIDYVRVYQ